MIRTYRLLDVRGASARCVATMATEKGSFSDNETAALSKILFAPYGADAAPSLNQKTLSTTLGKFECCVICCIRASAAFQRAQSRRNIRVFRPASAFFAVVTFRQPA